MPDILFFNEIDDANAKLVGGKGASLGKAAGAGLPVPVGFVITTQAYRRLAERGIRSDSGFVRAIAHAWESIGGGLVAVRSSATGEDAAEASFAGQQETILGVNGNEAIIDAIERCWRSLFTERAVAYREKREGILGEHAGASPEKREGVLGEHAGGSPEKQNVAAASIAMAVVVQQLVLAESAGVLFTRDPLDPAGQQMLAEALVGIGRSGGGGTRAAGPLCTRSCNGDRPRAQAWLESGSCHRQRRRARSAGTSAAVLPE